MPKHTKAEQKKNRMKKEKDKKKKKLIPTGKFDAAHPASETLMARKAVRDNKRKK